MSEKDVVASVIEHLDRRLDAQDAQRAAEFRHAYDKLDTHAKETARSMTEFRAETTAAIGDLALKIARHDMRIGSIEGKAQLNDARQHDWKKVGVAAALGGGTLVTLWEKLKEAMR